jgi:hypothetical protein
MSFRIKGAIFKNTPEKLQQRLGDRYDAGKKYPDVDGVFGIKEEDRMAFASYIMNAAPNANGEIPVRVTGYNNTSQASGIKYLGLSLEPDFKTMKQLEENQGAGQAAQSLAQATGGAVVQVSQDDLF